MTRRHELDRRPRAGFQPTVEGLEGRELLSGYSPSPTWANGDGGRSSAPSLVCGPASVERTFTAGPRFDGDGAAGTAQTPIASPTPAPTPTPAPATTSPLKDSTAGAGTITATSAGSTPTSVADTGAAVVNTGTTGVAPTSSGSGSGSNSAASGSGAQGSSSADSSASTDSGSGSDQGTTTDTTAVEAFLVAAGRVIGAGPLVLGGSGTGPVAIPAAGSGSGGALAALAGVQVGGNAGRTLLTGTVEIRRRMGGSPWGLEEDAGDGDRGGRGELSAEVGRHPAGGATLGSSPEGADLGPLRSGDLLTDFLPAGRAAVDRAIDEFLGAFEDLGNNLARSQVLPADVLGAALTLAVAFTATKAILKAFDGSRGWDEEEVEDGTAGGLTAFPDLLGLES